MRLAAISLLVSSSLVLAKPQYGGPPAGGGTTGSPTTGSPTSTSAAALPSASVSGQHIIQVYPNQQFLFQPNNLTVNENDTVTFAFPPSPITHSVTQSSFNSPCNLLNENGTGQLGFDSSLQQNDQFTIVITNASQPIWFFCKQFGPPNHCGSGMVGAINPPTSGQNTFANYLAAAEKLGASQPQETHSGGLTGLGALATASAASVSPQSTTGAADRMVPGGLSLLSSLAFVAGLLL